MKSKRLHLHSEEISLIYSGMKTQIRVPVKVRRRGNYLGTPYGMVDLRHPYATYLTERGLCWLNADRRLMEPMPREKVMELSPFGGRILVLERARLSNCRGEGGVTTHYELEYPARDAGGCRVKTFGRDSFGDGAPFPFDWEKFCSPAQLPSWAVRLKLGVEEVAVERLGDITPEDIEAEGVRGFAVRGGAMRYGTFGGAGADPHEAYRHLWDRTRSRHSWERDRWVWKIRFSPEPV